MSKGDYIEVKPQVRAAGPAAGPTSGSIRVTAQKQGRSIEASWEKDGNIQWFVAKEMTRGGTVVQEVRFQATEILAITVVQKET